MHPHPTSSAAPLPALVARRRRARVARSLASVGLAAALAAGAGACSGGDDDAGTTTTAPPTTTTTRPLDPVAADRELAFLATDERGQSRVVLTDGLGSQNRVVAEIPGRVEQLTWSPDGTQLLLDGDGAEGADFELSIVDVESGEVTPLAPSPTSNEGGARWSPDGTEVAFFSDREGGFAGYVVDVASGQVVRITPPEAVGVANLAWSPDGTQIAFSTSFRLESDVWVVAPDGSDARKVSTEAGSTQPTWSPDGDRLAISAQPLGEETSGIYLIDLTAEATEVLADTEYTDGFPVWSPDGEWVYFISEAPNEDADGGAADDIFRVAADGGEPEAVVADGISVELEVDVAAGDDLIAFSVVRLGDKEVFVANGDGSGAIPVSRSEAFDGFGVWRPVVEADESA